MAFPANQLVIEYHTVETNNPRLPWLIHELIKARLVCIVPVKEQDPRLITFQHARSRTQVIHRTCRKLGIRWYIGIVLRFDQDSGHPVWGYYGDLDIELDPIDELGPIALSFWSYIHTRKAYTLTIVPVFAVDEARSRHTKGWPSVTKNRPKNSKPGPKWHFPLLPRKSRNRR